ncbi:DNA-directed RNA polymerase subunit delta [Xenorhabdus hominickii]|uniref:DNA-directed RNA polymerase subunit delta n=1 Tax=Xenorhabdus hominickii TaxID=351679 RepID=A0A2G0Q8A6_XENHO|nr:DNA-directed RNA polymerase subunit delta [Xenorhabdus hominickii]PHM55441.1 DNA-directed RNA polymerase subunit delta [Xenorhabdus hominickii]PHM57194.1 DNA-directed RNA polymerase subunit delta [Xenorhabdus hominickii]
MDIRTTLRAASLSLALVSTVTVANEALVFQTDFGLKDGAVSVMKGISFKVNPSQPIYDLTHEIPPYNIWEASYRLYQTLPYWPKGTVFVSVVDPGVGTDRRSVVIKTQSGHYIVSPDNGTLTLVAEHFGIESVRQIDEKFNRVPGSEKSYTFHGRDVYAYTGARLASGIISYEQVGPLLPNKVVKIPYQTGVAERDGTLKGTIPVLDVRFGNVWSNINDSQVSKVGIHKGDQVCIKISEGDKIRYEGKAPYVSSFGEVPEGQPLVYLNSLLQVSVALNMDNFAARYQVQSGDNWRISLKKCSD